MDKFKMKIVYKVNESKKYLNIKKTKSSHRDQLISRYIKDKYNINISVKETNAILKMLPYEKSKIYSYNEMLIIKFLNKKVSRDKISRYMMLYKSVEITVTQISALIDNYSRASRAYYKTEKISINNICNKKRLTLEEEQGVIDLYKQGMSSYALADMYNFKTKKSILDILSRHNISPRKSSDYLRENLSYKHFSLESIDSIEKAYFIGLMLTDGYINFNRGYLSLELTDKDAMTYISKYIQCGIYTINPKEDNHKVKYRIVIYGKELVEQCRRFGFVENKTYNMKNLNLFKSEEKYLSHIIRGIIDGDGWISSDGKEFFIVSASNDFIVWCKQALENLGCEDLKINFIKNDNNGIYSIRSRKKINIEVLKKKVYTTKYGMIRKYDRLHGETFREHNGNYFTSSC